MLNIFEREEDLVKDFSDMLIALSQEHSQAPTFSVATSLNTLISQPLIEETILILMLTMLQSYFKKDTVCSREQGARS